MQIDESRSEQICQILLKQSKPITCSELGKILGLSPRDLRAHGSASSILDRANVHAMEKHGLFIIRSMSGRGVAITDDVGKIWAARCEWYRLSDKISRRISLMDEGIDFILEKKGRAPQLRLDLEAH